MAACFEAGDLGDDRRHFFMKLKTVVVDKESSDPAEIEAWEEILKVKAEDVTPPLVSARVCDNRMLATESV